MYAAINAGAQTLWDNSKERVILLFTDGYENSSLRYLNEYSAFINQVIDTVKAYEARLIIIGLGDVNDVLLRELTYYTNGSFYHLQALEDIKDVYYDINHNLRSYYEITLRPKPGKGENLIALEYFNNQNLSTTERPFFSGKDYDLLKYEIDSQSYWFDSLLVSRNYNLVATPQTLVNFQLNNDKIDPQFYKSLNSIVKLMKSDPGMTIRLYGHTDTRGTEEHNMELSRRRVKAVYQYLVRHGIHGRRIQMQAFGESRPIWQNDQAEWAARENRRVEFVLWKKSGKISGYRISAR
jgi:outer membrane protein OmpA-like peptidoglycan-associated protein